VQDRDDVVGAALDVPPARRHRPGQRTIADGHTRTTTDGNRRQDKHHDRGADDATAGSASSQSGAPHSFMIIGPSRSGSLPPRRTHGNRSEEVFHRWNTGRNSVYSTLHSL
jgi:hypothetical protein